jgi:hypothetical protein
LLPLPLISIIYERWGFDTLSAAAGAAAIILALVSGLPAEDAGGERWSG